MPNDFDLGEIRIADEIENTSADYREWLTGALASVGKEALISA